jgi:hypothetical protein
LQDFGAKHVYDWVFPDTRGRDRRKLLNGFSAWLSIAMRLIGAAVGSSIAGPLGAILGFGGGLMFGEHLARKHRFHRP